MGSRWGEGERPGYSTWGPRVLFEVCVLEFEAASRGAESSAHLESGIMVCCGKPVGQGIWSSLAHLAFYLFIN